MLGFQPGPLRLLHRLPRLSAALVFSFSTGAGNPAMKAGGTSPVFKKEKAATPHLLRLCPHFALED